MLVTVIDESTAALADTFGISLSRNEFVFALVVLSLYTYTNSHLFPLVQNVVYNASDNVILLSTMFMLYLLTNQERVHKNTKLFALLGIAAGNIKPLRSNIVVSTVAAFFSLLTT